jgi:hypothetical protein
LDFINRYEFDKCEKRHFGDYRVHGLDSWNQFVQLFFGQITSLDYRFNKEKYDRLMEDGYYFSL